MKKIILGLLTFGLAQAVFCQKATTQKLDELMNAYSNTNKFNGSVLIAAEGKILLQKGYGWKNVSENSKNDVNSVFRIYSVTKTFTSTVILKLVELKKLALSDKLSKFYPGFPNGDSISIEHLLTHTSGIYEYTKGNNMPDQTERSLIEFLKSKPLDFSPGTSWSYSNSGYWLLGFIIQKVTGISYEDAVRNFILKPLRMEHTGFDFKYLKSTDKSTGYEIFTSEEKKEAEVYEPPGPFAAGAIYSTVGDLYKFHRGLQTFKIIGEALLRSAYTAYKNNYGYGWAIRTYEGNEVVSHSGGAAGFRSNLARIPKKDICVVLLNNTENANTEVITKNIVNILLQKEYILPTEIHLSKEILYRYTGYYRVSPVFSMHITIEDGRLNAQATGQGNSILLARKENYFYSEEANGFVEFIKDEKGLFNELIIHQGGQDVHGIRFVPGWGLIGSAGSNGWEGNVPDIEFKQDSLQKGIWRLDSIQLVAGEYKFRFNNDWNINYGDNGNDGILEMYGENIKTEGGAYNIILDLTDKQKPTYKISKLP